MLKNLVYVGLDTAPFVPLCYNNRTVNTASNKSVNIALRRLRAEDISQVIEIEKEAFSPLWLGTQFKRDLNNRYACYLVAYLAQEADSAWDDAVIDWKDLAEKFGFGSITGVDLYGEKMGNVPDKTYLNEKSFHHGENIF